MKNALYVEVFLTGKKERRYTEKPEEAKKRHHYFQNWDYCQY